jgi:hypothetical protein
MVPAAIGIKGGARFRSRFTLADSSISTSGPATVKPDIFEMIVTCSSNSEIAKRQNDR